MTGCSGENTYFNFCDVVINPTRKGFGENNSDTLCKSSTCFSFHEFPPSIRDNVLSSAHWCNHSKVNLEFVPEGQTHMTDLRRPRAKKKADDIAPDMFPQAQPLPGPSSDIWPARDPVVLLPPDEEQDENPPQIFGDLLIMDPLPVGEAPPPFVSKDHFNSMIFLSC